VGFAALEYILTATIDIEGRRREGCLLELWSVYDCFTQQYRQS